MSYSAQVTYANEYRGSRVKIKHFFLFSVALSMVSAGFALGWPSPTTPLLLIKYPTITLDDIPIIIGYLSLGIVPGCIITTHINDYIGRKKTILITLIPYLISTILAIFPFNILCIKIARFLAGISFGAIITTLPVYASEISSPENRGKLSISISGGLTTGLVLQNAVGAFLSIEMNGLVTMIFGVVTLILTLLIPESPYYHLMNHDAVGATKSLQILRQRNEVSAELHRIIEGMKKQRKHSTNFLELLNKQSRKPFVFSIMLFTLQEAVGLNAIVASLQTIFRDINSSIPIKLFGIILAVLMVPSILVFTCLIDRLGRRKLLIATTTIMGLSVFNLSLFFYIQGIGRNINENVRIGAAVLVFLYMCGIVVSAGIPALYVGELMPTNTKTLGSCVCQAWGAISAFLTIQIHRSLTVWIGVYAPYLVYFVGCIGMVGFTYYLPETSGKTLEDIQNELESSNLSRIDDKTCQLISSTDHERQK